MTRKASCEEDRKRPTRVLTRNLLFSGCSSTTTRQCAERPLLTSFRRRRRRRRTLHVDRTSTDIGPNTGPRRWWQTTIGGPREDPWRTIGIGANGRRRRRRGGSVTATTSAARPVLALSYSNENALNMAADDRTSDGVTIIRLANSEGDAASASAPLVATLPRRRRWWWTVGWGECGGTNRDNRVWRAGWC